MTELLENVADRPAPLAEGSGEPDLLSHVLAQIRLSGDRVVARVLPADAELVLDGEGAAHLFVVTEGAMRIEAEGGIVHTAAAGDLILLPRGDGLRLRASSEATTLVVCRFRFDPRSPTGMVLALPQVLHIRRSEGQGWLDGIVRFLLIEADDDQPGASLMISRLIDLVVIRTLRTWVQRGQTHGWLGGLSDARIARALKAIHERPFRRWSVEDLAAVASMSRSSFCARFAALLGRPPLRYHNEWRLTLARERLDRGSARVGAVGLEVGYGSEAAFSRAYKALFGHSPRSAARVHREAERAR